MRTSDFDYTLPPEYIAQTPTEPRDSSRLLVLKRETGAIGHHVFREIGQFLHPNDLLVINRTRVIPARLFARKLTGGRIEVLLLRREAHLTWECLVGGKGLAIGSQLTVESGDFRPRVMSGKEESGNSGLRAEIVEVFEGSRRRLRFSEPIEPFFDRVGHVPLPPYIHTALQDPERYQTVYASDPGSAAAPTAGLHFTERLMDELKVSGCPFRRGHPARRIGYLCPCYGKRPRSAQDPYGVV